MGRSFSAASAQLGHTHRVIGFAIGAMAAGLVGLIFSRQAGEMCAAVFRKSTWVGLNRSAAEWRQTNIVIAVMFLLGGGALLAYGITLAAR